jgi:mannose-6-phosphate isomerase
VEPTKITFYKSSIKKNILKPCLVCLKNSKPKTLIKMKHLHLVNTENKNEIFAQVQDYLNELKLRIDKQDFHRPWGGFFVIDERDTVKFIELFFPDYTISNLMLGNKLSPKILVVAPQKRLSWQYHHRRAEIWNLIAGEAGIVTSVTDEETTPRNLLLQETIVLEKGERHRLVGLDGFGIIAEIWQHTNPDLPSDEEDIVRLQDDFGR